jgi:hypothetical protein
MIERDSKMRALGRRYPDLYKRFGLPSSVRRGWAMGAVLEHRLQGLLLLVVIGLILNYSYYERLSLHYLLVGGVQDWFAALQRLLDEGLGAGRNYNALYVAINGVFYGSLFWRGAFLLQAMLVRWRMKATWVLALTFAATAYCVVAAPPFGEWPLPWHAFSVK